MTAPKTFADVEGGLRTWFRAQSDITSVVSSRVFFGVPDGVTFPIITLQRIGGGPQRGEAPLDDALIQIDCWGGIGNKAQAWAVTAAVLAVLESMTPQELASGVYGYGASVDSVNFFPDPSDGRSRYVVTATVTVRSA